MCVEGFDAFARVLLKWYTYRKWFFLALGKDEVSVEGLLLWALKAVSDSELLMRIEEALFLRRGSGTWKDE